MLRRRITLSGNSFRAPLREVIRGRLAGVLRLHSASGRTKRARRMPKVRERWGSPGYLTEGLTFDYQRFSGSDPLMCHENFIVWSRRKW
jgi:hypothetical protein